MKYSDYIIFSDFDGTITNIDVLDKIIIDIYGFDMFRYFENQLINNEISYETYLYNVFNDLNYDISSIDKNIVDEHFKSFYDWTIDNIEFHIVSAGFKQIINHLVPYVENIHANEVSTNDGWNVLLKNDKSINKNDIIKQYNKKSIFIGDGISDLCVVGNVDILFCKRNTHLHKKCIDENHKHYVFDNFKDIKEMIENVINYNNKQ